MAVIEAAEDVVSQLKERAAALWNVTTEQVDYKNGVALNLAGDDQMTLAEICAAAEKTGGQISGRANVNARGAGPSFAVHLCDVKVDQETGKTDVVRYTAIQTRVKPFTRVTLKGSTKVAPCRASDGRSTRSTSTVTMA